MEVTEAEREAAWERLRASNPRMKKAGINDEEMLAAIAEDDGREAPSRLVVGASAEHRTHNPHGRAVGSLRRSPS